MKRNSSTTGALTVFHEPGYVSTVGGRVCGNADVEAAKSAQIHAVAIMSQRTASLLAPRRMIMSAKMMGLAAGLSDAKRNLREK
jgi:hypothetical protein